MVWIPPRQCRHLMGEIPLCGTVTSTTPEGGGGVREDYGQRKGQADSGGGIAPVRHVCNHGSVALSSNCNTGIGPSPM